MDTKINDDWHELGLWNSQKTDWVDLFIQRQETIRTFILDASNFLILALRKLVSEYAVRAWTDFECGDLVEMDNKYSQDRDTGIIIRRHADCFCVSFFCSANVFNQWICPQTRTSCVFPLRSLRIRKVLPKDHHTNFLRMIDQWLQAQWPIRHLKHYISSISHLLSN